MRSRNYRGRRLVGDYAEIRKAGRLEAHMQLQELTAAQVAVRCTHEQGYKVSRQMVSYLKTGRLKRCTPDLAKAICKVLNLPVEDVFVMHQPRNESARKTPSKTAA